uniref:Secreted protein n=1 Tax=Populus trichocarpa TaxID=3694 RepID=A0A2K1ZIZ6_POPTR
MRASLCIKGLILCFFLKTKSFCSNQLPCLLSTIYNSPFLPSPVILLRPGLLLIAVSPPGIDVLPSTVLSASNCWVGLLKVKR